jgi:membrane-associated phospholipid phosphatase
VDGATRHETRGDALRATHRVKGSWLLTCLSICSLLAAPAAAEGPPAEERSKPRPGTVTRVIGAGADFLQDTVVDAAGIIISPINWRTREWLTFGAVGGVTALFIVYADEPIRESAQASSQFRKFGETIRPLGRVAGFAAVTGGMLLSGIVLDRAKDRETARLVFESVAISYLIESSLKHALGRARPGSGLGSRDFEFFGGNKSMPSGEVTLAFTMAGVVTSQYNRWWVKLLAYSLATAVAAGRIASDGHWTSDVIVSAALGVGVAKSVVWRHRKRKDAKAKQPKWDLGFSGTGARFTYTW